MPNCQGVATLLSRQGSGAMRLMFVLALVTLAAMQLAVNVVYVTIRLVSG